VHNEGTPFYPVASDILTDTTIQLISTSSDSPAMSELPITSSPLHPVSGKGLSQASRMREGPH